MSDSPTYQSAPKSLLLHGTPHATASVVFLSQRHLQHIAFVFVLIDFLR